MHYVPGTSRALRCARQRLLWLLGSVSSSSLRKEGYCDNNEDPAFNTGICCLSEWLYATQGCTLRNDRAGFEPRLDSSQVQAPSFHVGMLLCVALCR